MQVLEFLRRLPATALGSAQKIITSGGKSSGGKKNVAKISLAALLMPSSPSWLPRTPMLPLSDGDALGLVYLEWLVINTPLDSESLAHIHDEYAKLLMEKIPSIRYLTAL